MKEISFTGITVIKSSQKSFEQVTQAIESKVGKANHFLFQKLINTRQSLEQVKISVESMVGQSGLMIFAQFDGGSLFSLWGKSKQAKLYIIGNPLIAHEMFGENPAVGLYVPLRPFVYDALPMMAMLI